MTQEEKELVLKDLSARSPYGVLVHYCNKSHTLYTNDFVLNERLLIEFRCTDCCVELKPYLRPMSSMTEEERKEYEYITERWMHDNSYSIGDSIDWLNKHHFDYRGLIPKGLALEAPKGMYNIKTGIV